MDFNLAISEKAIVLIVAFEVTGQSTYEARYQRPAWPGGSSGVTIGVGYDVGYSSAEGLSRDWQDQIGDAMIASLQTAVGVKGIAAKPLAHELGATVLVPWDAANTVFRSHSIPPLTNSVAGALPNCDKLSPDSLGALVSLAYNRGVSFSVPDDRHLEMRAIKAHMIAQQFQLIPGEFRSMKRLWPDSPGLQDRREKEAVLFEQGLVAAA